MKLCLIGDGNSIHIVRWAEYFHAKGHEVQMISLTKLREPSKAFNRYCEIPVLKGPLAYLRRVLPIRDAVGSWRPDIVHGHYLTSAGFYAAMSGCKNVVVSAWGSDIYKDSQDKYKAWCIKYALRHADLVFGDSDHIVKTAKLLVPSLNGHKVIFGIDTEKFKPEPIPHDKFRFLSIRQTGPIYNPMTIVKAFELANLDAYLWMFKPTVECQDVYDYVKSKPELDKKITWIDKLSYDEMPKLYNSVDVGISIPNWDSSSTAMLECMSCGVPVIANYIPQNEEWIEDDYEGVSETVTGFFIDDDYDSSNEQNLTYALERAFILGGTERTDNARAKVIADGNMVREFERAEKLYLELLEEGE